MYKSSLKIGETLTPEEILYSNAGPYQLEYAFGRFVISHNHLFNYWNWRGDKFEKIDHKIKILDKGNFAVLDKFDFIIWESPITEKKGVELMIDKDGILSLYSEDREVTWSTNRKKLTSSLTGGKLELRNYTSHKMQRINQSSYQMRVWNFDEEIPSKSKTIFRIEEDEPLDKLIFFNEGAFVVYKFVGTSIQLKINTDPHTKCVITATLSHVNGYSSDIFSTRRFEWTENCEKFLQIDEYSLLPNSLKLGNQLRINQQLVSDNEKYNLILQEDGNLVLYDENKKARWNTPTYKRFSQFFELSKQGNLAIVSDKNKIVWEFKPTKKKGYELVLEDNGNLILYAEDKEILWAIDKWAKKTDIIWK